MGSKTLFLFCFHGLLATFIHGVVYCRFSAAAGDDHRAPAERRRDERRHFSTASSEVTTQGQTHPETAYRLL
jgi:hypothetical protein